MLGRYSAMCEPRGPAGLRCAEKMSYPGNQFVHAAKRVSLFAGRGLNRIPGLLFMVQVGFIPIRQVQMLSRHSQAQVLREGR